MNGGEIEMSGQTWFKGEYCGKLEYSDACVGSVEFRTNGPQGGAASHGGFLEIKFDTDRCSTALEASVDGKHFDNVETVTLRFRGDAEMRVARQCFEFLASKLGAVRD
jgi:hypothetical protein